MLTAISIACATVLGVILLAVVTRLIGPWLRLAQAAAWTRPRASARRLYSHVGAVPGAVECSLRYPEPHGRPSRAATAIQLQQRKGGTPVCWSRFAIITSIKLLRR
jgi:uncharacterized membrane protein YcjF (UPF0283 family)